MTSSTIAALATAPAPAGIAIIRVSGPDATRALKALFRSSQSPALSPRKLVLGSLIDFRTEQVIDQALAVYMPNPDSFTGEDVVEFQFHGSPLLVQKMLRSLFAFGISPAEPGEFTKRAFLNGKLDLIQAEAVAELINATSDRALHIASAQVRGALSSVIDQIGEPLRDLLAELEARIDFPEEEIEPEGRAEIFATLSRTEQQISNLLRSYRYGATVREGFRVLLCGAPNAGKSSLLNLLLGRERAIVTDISGTTRDLIEESVTFDGYRLIFCDSAGIAQTDDQVEKIGIELAQEKVSWADLVVLVVDASDHNNSWQTALERIRPEAKQIWMFVNKIDLNPAAIGQIYCDSSICHQNFYISAKTGDGLESVQQAFFDEISSRQTDQAESAEVVAQERHRHCLERANSAIGKARETLEEELPIEITSAEVRIGLSSLEELIGKTYTEDILGRIFSKFCVGK